jgi:hypothetical protein
MKFLLSVANILILIVLTACSSNPVNMSVEKIHMDKESTRFPASEHSFKFGCANAPTTVIGIDAMKVSVEYNKKAYKNAKIVKVKTNSDGHQVQITKQSETATEEIDDTASFTIISSMDSGNTKLIYLRVLMNAGFNNTEILKCEGDDIIAR